MLHMRTENGGSRKEIIISLLLTVIRFLAGYLWKSPSKRD